MLCPPPHHKIFHFSGLYSEKVEHLCSLTLHYYFDIAKTLSEVVFSFQAKLNI